MLAALKETFLHTLIREYHRTLWLPIRWKMSSRIFSVWNFYTHPSLISHPLPHLSVPLNPPFLNLQLRVFKGSFSDPQAKPDASLTLTITMYFHSYIS